MSEPLLCDFNGPWAPWGLLVSAPDTLLCQSDLLGRRVELIDCEGNRCQGDITVVSIQKGLVAVALDRTTWVDG